MSGLSKEGRRRLLAELRSLHGVSPWYGLLHLAVRLPLQAALSALAWHAWLNADYAAFAGWGLMAAFCFASLISLTHDALHHRLTGINWLDEIVARLISWPIAWPIAVYKHLHLIHHRLSGSDLADPERISPLASDWQHSKWRRFRLRHQLWLHMFIYGSFGLLIKLLAGVAGRLSDRAILRALANDIVGIVVVLGCLGLLAFRTQGMQGVFGFVLLWAMHERVVGIMHQFRNHMEHYGLWGEQEAFVDTQYVTARTIKTNLFARLYFNHLNRHADHHVAPAIPFYKLERAHKVIAKAYQQEGFESLETEGYFSALHEVLRDMRASYGVNNPQPNRLRKHKVSP